MRRFVAVFRASTARSTRRGSRGKFVLSTRYRTWSRQASARATSRDHDVDHARVTMPICKDVGRRKERLTEAELHAFFDGLFAEGFAGADMLTEIAPEGWER